MWYQGKGYETNRIQNSKKPRADFQGFTVRYYFIFMKKIAYPEGFLLGYAVCS